MCSRIGYNSYQDLQTLKKRDAGVAARGSMRNSRRYIAQKKQPKLKESREGRQEMRRRD